MATEPQPRNEVRLVETGRNSLTMPDHQGRPSTLYYEIYERHPNGVEMVLMDHVVFKTFIGELSRYRRIAVAGPQPAESTEETGA